MLPHQKMRKSNPDKMKTNPRLKTAARGSVLGLIGIVFSRFFSLFIQIAIARMFGITIFGYYITGIMVCRILQVVSGLGLPIGSARFLIQMREHGDIHAMQRIFWTTITTIVLSGSFIGGIVYFGAPFLCFHIFHKPDLVVFIRIFSFGIPWLALLRSLAEQSRSFESVRYTVLIEDIGLPLLQSFILTLAFLRGAAPWAAAFSFVASCACCTLIMGWTVLQQMQSFSTQQENMTDKSVYNTKKLLAYSIPLMPTGLFFMLSNNIDIFMLNLFANGSSVGVYAAATRWTMLVESIGTPVYAIFRPLLAKAITNNDHQSMKTLLKASCRWVLYLTLPCTAALIIASQPAMNLFLKETSLQTASLVLCILLLARTANPLGNSTGIMLAMGGQQHRELASLCCGTLLNILLNYILIPSFGIIGAAIATGSGFFITTFLRIHFCWQNWKIHPWSTRMLIPLSGLAGVLCVHFMLAPTIPYGWSLTGGILSFFTLCLMTLLFGCEQEDHDMFHLLPGSIRHFVKNIPFINPTTSTEK